MGRQTLFLTLWQSRLFETIRHVWCTRYSALKSSIALQEASESENANSIRARNADNNSQEALLEIHETYTLSTEAAQWRDSIRDYPANFYAYAAPTTEALDTISNCFESSEIEEILEAGAGTGYWSALLLSCLKKNEIKRCSAPAVLPYDITPPSMEMNKGDNVGAVGSNEYHGDIPTFIRVHQADSLSKVQSASAVGGTALLLCYPPPASNMAHQALSTHISNGGNTVIHIGEWQGLTGDNTFETLLAEQFYCQEKNVIPLPWWGTDATYLTIWTKKGSGKGCNAQDPESTSHSSALGYCSANECPNHAKRRCRYARSLQYCSSECFKKDIPHVRAALALHMMTIVSQDELSFENDGHFMDLNGMCPSYSASSERPKKKRKKKRR